MTQDELGFARETLKRVSVAAGGLYSDITCAEPTVSSLSVDHTIGELRAIRRQVSEVLRLWEDERLQQERRG
jgi:hypothetical protein